jgi:hypothetical protein
LCTTVVLLYAEGVRHTSPGQRPGKTRDADPVTNADRDSNADANTTRPDADPNPDTGTSHGLADAVVG